MKKIKYRWDMGVYVAFCPYCDELVYEKDRCVFCGKPYEYVEGKHKPTIVEEDEYTIVQATNNHIQIYKDGRMVMHMSCRKKKTEDELRSTIELYESLSRKGAEEDDNRSPF